MTAIDVSDLLKATDNVMRIEVGHLSTDSRVNTRSIDEKWVSARVETFNPDAMGALVVSLRDDNTFIVLDGQHRAELARRAKGDDFPATCIVHEHLTLAEEAALFRALNSARKVTPMQKFLARLTEGDSVATGILATVREHGWEVDGRQAAGRINAVSALFKIYDEGSKEGRVTLDAVMGVVTSSWGHQADAVNVYVLNGMGLFLRRHHHVALDDLVTRLQSFPGGPRGLVGDARGRRFQHRGSTSVGVAAALVDLYNQRRRGANRLPAWN